MKRPIASVAWFLSMTTLLALGACASGGGAERVASGALLVADDVPITAASATLVVHGMSCPLCANNVDKQLLDIAGVTEVLVDMGTGEVTLNLAADVPVTRRQLVEAVDRSGFTLAEVRIQ